MNTRLDVKECINLYLLSCKIYSSDKIVICLSWGSDLVLGVEWLAGLGEVEVNFEKLTLAVKV